MVKVKKNLLQVRHSDAGLRVTSNHYLDAFAPDYRRIVVFLTGDPVIDGVAPIDADEVIYLKLARSQLKGLRLTARRKISEIILRYKISLILAHRWKPTYLAAVSTPKDGSIAIISVVHALHQLDSWTRRLQGRFLLKKRCRFVGVSEAVRLDILNSGFGVVADNVLALPNCINIEKSQASLYSRIEARQLLALNEDEFVCGHVGRLSGSKDQKTMLRAFAKVHARHRKIRLVIIGDGRLKDELLSEADSLDLGESVIFAGARDDAIQLMPAFDIFLMTSVTEGFPRVLLEAMVCHLPIVSTDSGGIREVLGEEFPYCEMANIGEIATAIERLLEMAESDRKACGEENYQRVVESFSFPIFRKKLRRFADNYCLSSAKAQS